MSLTYPGEKPVLLPSSLSARVGASGRGRACDEIAEIGCNQCALNNGKYLTHADVAAEFTGLILTASSEVTEVWTVKSCSDVLCLFSPLSNQRFNPVILC